jgi:hypothetical protein
MDKRDVGVLCQWRREQKWRFLNSSSFSILKGIIPWVSPTDEATGAEASFSRNPSSIGPAKYAFNSLEKLARGRE